jgi:membrane associated rhomboid family serine protease
MRALFDKLTTDQADTCGLVLSSSGISYRVKRGRKGWEVWVDEDAYDRASESIKQYFKENQDTVPPSAPTEDEFQKSYTGIWAAIILLVWHMAFLWRNNIADDIRRYGASATDILHGEWFRLLTALMLHADGVHLIGNMVGIAVFGTAVCGIAGYGVGWLMILITGISGNFFNTVLVKAGHISIGASTALFGAIGILAGHQFYKRYGIPGKRVRAWLPLGGGLALLGFLGSGGHSDLTAHFFGFMSGILLGILYALKFRHRQEMSIQRYCLFLSFGILVFSWLTAFSSA